MQYYKEKSNNAECGVSTLPFCTKDTEEDDVKLLPYIHNRLELCSKGSS